MNASTNKLSTEEIDARRRLLFLHVNSNWSEREFEQYVYNLRRLVHIPDELVAEAMQAHLSRDVSHDEGDNDTAAYTTNNQQQTTRTVTNPYAEDAGENGNDHMGIQSFLIAGDNHNDDNSQWQNSVGGDGGGAVGGGNDNNDDDDDDEEERARERERQRKMSFALSPRRSKRKKRESFKYMMNSSKQHQVYNEKWTPHLEDI